MHEAQHANTEGEALGETKTVQMEDHLDLMICYVSNLNDLS